MIDDELLELMKERWTVRKFLDRDVPEEELDKILEAGRWAPSGGNKQPWELVIIKDREKRDKVAEIYSEAMGLKGRSKRYTTPPILIAVCIDTRVRDSYPDEMPADFIVYASVGSMVQNMMLMAAELGLGLSWGTQPKRVQKELKELLDIPEHLEIPDILQLGYPDQERYSSSRKELDDFVHHDSVMVD